MDIQELHLELPRLAPEFSGLRIAQISDIHIGTWINAPQLRQAVDLVNSLSPDVIALTGDFVTFEPHRFVSSLTAELSRLNPRLVSLAILGNHDHWTDPDIVRLALTHARIIDLSNNVYTIQDGDACLHFGGVDDYMNNCDRLDLVLKQIPETGAAILLAHEPDFADISAATGRFDLQLSGHAHGGQVNLPVIGPPFLPNYGKKYYSGLYQVGSMLQYTNRGLGTAELQVRFNCRPEITLITLEPVKNDTTPDSI